MNSLSAKKFFFLTLLSLIIFNSSKISHANPFDDDHGIWSYSGETGPKHWGHLSPDYKMCTIGMEQSPIDITETEGLQATAINFNYKPAKIKLEKTTHNLYAYFPAHDNTIGIDFDQYTLESIQLHVPSEHTFQGKHYPMEANLIHKNKNNDYVAVAIIFDIGAANSFIDKLFTLPPPALNKIVTIDNAKLNAKELLPSNLSYYNYMGSLTYPNCQEGINWIVLYTPSTVSEAQIQHFKKTVIDHNNRPIQPLNQREIKKIVQN